MKVMRCFDPFLKVVGSVVVVTVNAAGVVRWEKFGGARGGVRRMRKGGKTLDR